MDFTRRWVTKLGAAFVFPADAGRAGSFCPLSGPPPRLTGAPFAGNFEGKEENSMKKKLLSLTLTLALCLGLTTPVFAAEITVVEDTQGNSYTISLPVIGTRDSVILHDPKPDGPAWERKGTAYVVSMSAEVTIPEGVRGTALLCLRFSDNQWLPVAYLPLDGSKAVVPFDAPVSLPDSGFNGVTYRGTIQQNSSEALLVISSSTNYSKSELGEHDVVTMGNVEDYAKNAILCLVGIKDTSEYVYTPVSKFDDVAITSPYAASINWAVKEGITTGYSDGTFKPGGTCTVSHILTFLWRANGRPGSGDNERTAVTAWAESLGIDTGSLNDPCTRAMAVTYMWKAAGSPAPKRTSSFSDVPASASYAKAVSWAVEQGITKGTTPTTFSPDKTCTRGQIVTFLYRAAQ